MEKAKLTSTAAADGQFGRARPKPPSSRWMRPGVLLGAYALFISYWFRYYCTDLPIASVDLPGHIAIVERLASQLLGGSIFFFDRAWFSGWPAFEFYGVVPHLIAALLSYPLALFSSEPARLSVHLLLVAGVSLLPFSVYFFAVRLLKSFSKTESRLAARMALAIVVGALSFWFLNHDRQWFGIGAAAPMHVGLFSQLFGWHLLLLYLGCLVSLIERSSGSARLGVALCCGLLFVTHTLTAVFACFFGLLSLLYFSGARLRLLLTHLVGCGFAAFWLVPWFAYAKTYTALDIHRPTGDFLELLLRYPMSGVVNTLETLYRGGPLSAIDPMQIVVWLLIITLFVYAKLRKSALYTAFLVFGLISLVVFSSGYTASSISVGFHYYRFIGYLFLFAIPVLAIVPVAACCFGKFSRTSAVLISLVFVALTASTTQFPHYERDRVRDSLRADYFYNENRVLEYLQNQEDKSGRVFFEYFDNYERYTWLGVHYMESRLFPKTGMETINGLFIQSSIAYRMPVVSANLLGARTYNTPLLFTDRAQLDDQTKVEQLRAAGIAWIVAGKKDFIEKLQSYAVAPPVFFGRYAVIQIREAKTPRIAPERRQLLGYRDFDGSLPFAYLEYYFYARSELYNRFTLIALTDKQTIPANVSLVLSNGKPPKGKDDDTTNSINLEFNPTAALQHYAVRYQHNVELDRFNEIEYHLENRLKLPILLGQLELKDAVALDEAAELAPPSFQWEEKDSLLRLGSLVPGTLYRINYSHAPFWKAEAGALYRGSEERMYVVPESTTMTLRYTHRESKPHAIGWAVTLASLMVLIFWYRRSAR